jgi:uncharacterized coiled-coil DUF342 family protein
MSTAFGINPQNNDELMTRMHAQLGQINQVAKTAITASQHHLDNTIKETGIDIMEDAEDKYTSLSEKIDPMIVAGNRLGTELETVSTSNADQKRLLEAQRDTLNQILPTLSQADEVKQVRDDIRFLDAKINALATTTQVDQGFSTQAASTDALKQSLEAQRQQLVDVLPTLSRKSDIDQVQLNIGLLNTRLDALSSDTKSHLEDGFAGQKNSSAELKQSLEAHRQQLVDVLPTLSKRADIDQVREDIRFLDAKINALATTTQTDQGFAAQATSTDALKQSLELQRQQLLEVLQTLSRQSDINKVYGDIEALNTRIDSLATTAQIDTGFAAQKTSTDTLKETLETQRNQLLEVLPTLWKADEIKQVRRDIELLDTKLNSMGPQLETQNASLGGLKETLEAQRQQLVEALPKLSRQEDIEQVRADIGLLNTRLDALNSLATGSQLTTSIDDIKAEMARMHTAMVTERANMFAELKTALPDRSLEILNQMNRMEEALVARKAEMIAEIRNAVGVAENETFIGVIKNFYSDIFASINSKLEHVKVSEEEKNQMIAKINTLSERLNSMPLTPGIEESLVKVTAELNRLQQVDFSKLATKDDITSIYSSILDAKLKESERRMKELFEPQLKGILAVVNSIERTNT